MILYENTDLEEGGQRLTDTKEQQEDTHIQSPLRPHRLDEFVGQSHIKDNLRISIEAAQKRSEPIEHVLLYGNPGLGKTTLAGIIAKEMGSHFRVTAGPALERVADLAAILSNLAAGDVLFIDEIHRMNTSIEEVLYGAMEEQALDIIVGKGPSARTMRMPIEPFTLIGATTKPHLISTPLRDRFGHVYHLGYYSPEEMSQIVSRSAGVLSVEIDQAATSLIAQRARRTPRIANRLLKRVRDYAQVHGSGIIDVPVTELACSLLRIDEQGLDDVDRKVLRTILTTFSGGPVGLRTLAAACAEDLDTIETMIEPYLIQIGYLDRTGRGRVTTDRAKEHLTLVDPRFV